MSAASARNVMDPRARRRGPQLVHLPTWSQLSIATRQHGAVGHGGDFFEIIQHRDGHVSTLLADVCGNGPSVAVPVSRLRWLVRQHLACGEAPGAVLALLERRDRRRRRARSVRDGRLPADRSAVGFGERRQRRSPGPVHQARLRRRPGAAHADGRGAGDYAWAGLSGDARSTSTPRTRSCWSPTASPIRSAPRPARSARPGCSPSPRARARPPNPFARR